MTLESFVEFGKSTLLSISRASVGTVWLVKNSASIASSSVMTDTLLMTTAAGSARNLNMFVCSSASMLVIVLVLTVTCILRNVLLGLVGLAGKLVLVVLVGVMILAAPVGENVRAVRSGITVMPLVTQADSLLQVLV